MEQAMTATDVPASVVRPVSIGATYRHLLEVGFDAPEAANITALKFGLDVAPQPWTVREVNHLVFLRQLRRAGNEWVNSDDRADRTDGSPVPVPVDSASGPALGRRADVEPSGGAVTLLKVFRSMAGPTATLDLLRPSARLRPDIAGDADREGR
jgi:hypothetical protein